MPYYVYMLIDQRDLSILTLVNSFEQLTTKHIHQILFNDRASQTPTYRAVNRMARAGLLAPIERRLVGGARGGAGQYVWQVGPAGHKVVTDDLDGDRPRYMPRRAISYHSLAIADTYLTVLGLAREGVLKLHGYTTEPDCHVTIGKYELKPDLTVDLERPQTGVRFPIMFEIDMGTQGQKQIIGKLARYWNAYNAADEAQWPATQLVVFVAIDEARAEELRWILGKGTADQRALFKVQTAADLSTALRG